MSSLSQALIFLVLGIRGVFSSILDTLESVLEDAGSC